MDRAQLLHRMALIRAFEAALVARPDHGFQLLSSGAEAVAVGVASALKPGDQVLTSGRSIGPALALGLTPEEVMAELLGRVGGPNRGKGGRGHLAKPSAGLFGAHAVVGGNLTIAAGVALALQAEARGRIAVCIFGDGACGAGTLHETFNMAALWKLPLVLVCDNNQMAVSTPVAKAIAARRLADLATPFGVPSSQVDGTDVLAVRAAMTSLIARARAGDGPGFLECLSERFSSHSSSTRETRSAAEMDRVRARCPIARLRTEMEAEGLDLSGLDQRVEAEVARALAFAEASAFPDPAEGLVDVD